MYPDKFRKTIVLALAAAAMTLSHGQQLPLRDAPEVRESAGILYVSGGVGTDDVNRMRALAPRFNVRIRFQDQADGASLSDVKVVVLNDKKERLLRLVTEGPLLYMRMPPGRYLLALAYQDNVQERTINVGRAAQDITFAFRVNELEDSWLYCRDGSARCKRQGE